MQRPATVNLRTSLYEDATAIVEAEYQQDLSLDDIARQKLADLERRRLRRRLVETARTDSIWTVRNGRRLLSFTCNDYLNLAQHPAVNDAERRLIELGRPPLATSEHPPIPWRSILSSPNIWLLGLVQTCSSALYYMFINWYPSYLEEGRGVAPQRAAWLAALVLGGAGVGCISGGYWNDRLARLTRYHPARFRFFGFAGTAIAAA